MRSRQSRFDALAPARLCAALLLALTTSVAVAGAQEREAVPQTSPAVRPPATLSPTVPESADQSAFDDAEGAAAASDPAVSGDDELPAKDTSLGDVPENRDGLEPVPRIGQRQSPAVSQPDDLPDAPALRDGIVEVGEPAPPQDGIDPVANDQRDPDDRSLFETPSGIEDPLLFQIEVLDPISDNRAPKRLFQLEPYDPIGIRVGSFVLFPEIELSTSAYSNVLRSPDAQSDVAFDFRPAARLVSNWNVHALELRAAGGLSWFDEFETENDRAYLVEARGRLDIARRTNLQALISRDEAQESRDALDAEIVGTRADITTDRAEVALNHRFNRLSLQLRGSLADYAYGDTENAGVVTANNDRDYKAYEETVRATWEFKPTFSVFSEVEVNQREYDLAAQSDLINRSSDGQRYRAGISFGNTGEILRGEIALGYGIQSPDDERLDDIDGLIIDANATWRVSALTSVLFSARSDVTETTTPNVGGAFARSVGVDVRHAFRRYLVGSAGLGYVAQVSPDNLIDEDEWRATLGVEYFANRETVLFARYAHTSFNDKTDDSDYENDEIHIGIRLRR